MSEKINGLRSVLTEKMRRDSWYERREEKKLMNAIYRGEWRLKESS
jgi:hypothetical protein